MEINKALEIITNSDDLYDGYGYLTKLGYEALATIEGADVVEVVRCKNCKHCEKAEEKYEGDRFEPTDIVCTVNNVYTYSNGFCSYGERKETDG